MGRALMHVGAWALATSAAVTLSWFGVRSVLRSTAYDPPRALPIPSATQPAEISATQRPSPRPSAPISARTSARTSASPSATPRRTATSPAPGRTRPPATGSVRPYSLKGGRVVLDLGATSASLVSATPNPGWQMSVWTPTGDGWLRVTFTSASGAEASTVSCTWNGHPPTVQAYEN
ncbi:hypothetical protein V2S66_09165 [Streptomyces sp. V4-01]|uniref:Secreted protein n=1 Tax=Actinacidiphila polyblastidii TaxID=3110430 RepID=A0ABU7P8J6_9ACTN|nr:hypothetical protein [Streptomyces sp. V4-01]